MNEQKFAQRLRQYRKDKGMTQQELADQLGVSNKTVSRWESGSYPDVTTLVALARALGVTVDELLDPKAPVRTLEKSDWQNLLSFAFVIGGGLLFYLLAQFVPVPLCWMLYVGCLAYGIYLQAHYTYHTRWFQLGVWVMVFFINWSAAGQLLAGATVLLGTVSGAGMLERILATVSQGYWDRRLILELLLYVLFWAALTIGLSSLTVTLAKRLAREPASGSVLPDLTRERLPRLQLNPVRFQWTKAVPVLAPLILMGYWCLFWRNDLPEKLYLSQKTIYIPLWAAVSLLTLLPLLKKGRRGMLLPAVLLDLASRAFSVLLVSPRAYDLINKKVVVDGTHGRLSGNHVYFGQVSWGLAVFAALLVLLYLVCCFVTIQRRPEGKKDEAPQGENGEAF